ncbi:MAG: LD-carboxypeptidase [Deltaproteobacteria bacterium]|nr:LD-carboxypeptidase [Deltaproteobacteria bacterium]
MAPLTPIPRKPPRLHPGDLIGVVSPAAAVGEDALRRGCAELERLGFTVRIGNHALDRHRFLAGTDQARAHELMTMLRDPAVRAVFCSRAGYGSGRVLPLLDFPALARHPKIFLGYSDASLLLNAFLQQAGWVSFHGPVVAGEFAGRFSPRSREHLLNLLTTGRGEEHLSFPLTLREGVAEGRLLGGCLSVLVTTLGTPFALDTRGAILFLEDVGEKPYRIDRMLTHLKQAGQLDDLAGVIFGEMSGCLGETNDPALLLSVINDLFSGYSYPVGFGLPAGHHGENFALPLGTTVRLDTRLQVLTFLESAVE